MSLVALLRKELYWSRRNALLLCVLVVLVPLFFAGASVLFQDVVPRNVPVAVVPGDETVTESELEIVEGTIESFTDPTIVDDQTTAKRQLERERIYGIITVPPDISEAGTEAIVTWTIDGAIVPFQSPSEVLQSLTEFHLDRVFDSEVSVERTVTGDVHDLPAFLFPTLLMTITIFFAFTYVPYVLRRERDVLDRVRVEASLESLLGAKLSFLTVVTLVPVTVFHLAAQYYGYEVASFHLGAVAVLLVTFLLLATVSATVMVLTRFSSVGTVLNLILMLGLMALSGLAFPRGYFSTTRTTIATLLPTHHGMIVVRSLMLKDVGAGTYLDVIGGLCGLTVLALLVLKLASVHYRRTV
jgi:ABC-2 type transport system permease protein